MNKSMLLTIDGIINLALGVLLVVFPAPLINALGIPEAPGFYPNILGGVLIGIAIALFIQRRKGSGLGLDGAVAINLCGGTVLAGWLMFGDLPIPLRGYLIMWGLVILLLGISIVELFARARTDSDAATE